MILALTTEHAWDFGLLGLSVLVLLGGVILARALAVTTNAVLRILFPVAALSILTAYAVFIYIARVHVKG